MNGDNKKHANDIANDISWVGYRLSDALFTAVYPPCYDTVAEIWFTVLTIYISGMHRVYDEAVNGAAREETTL